MKEDTHAHKHIVPKIRDGKRTSEYNSYLAAKGRCQNPNDDDYRFYGERGIRNHFATFEDFIAEVGPKPTPAHTIDRIDSNGHYEVGNVRWLTRAENNRNRRTPLNYQKAREIRAAHKAGVTQLALSKQYEVTVRAIWNVIHKRAWPEAEGQE